MSKLAERKPIYRHRMFPSLAERSLASLTSLPEIGRKTKVYATDLEGPLVLGDPIGELLSEKARPPWGDPRIDYGGILFTEQYRWFNEKTRPLRKTSGVRGSTMAQEANDTLFVLAPFLALGITDRQFHEQTQQYRLTPGAKELVQFLKREEAAVIAVTTAMQEPYKTVAKDLGIHGVIGSPFPIDEARGILEQSGRWNLEIGMTQEYLNDCYKLIDRMENAHNREVSENMRHTLHRRIEQFHEEELGITYSPTARVERKRTGSPHTTTLGEMIEDLQIIGDRGKAAVALSLFRKVGTADAATITIGDGRNDQHMLKTGDVSIALNGGPVDSAKIGVVTPNVQALIPLYQLVFNNIHDIRKNPRVLDQIIDVAHNLLHRVDPRIIVHKGGNNVSEDVLAAHATMKKELRDIKGPLVD